MWNLVAMFLIDLAVTVLGYVLQPKTDGSTTKPGAPTAPQADEGGVVPVVFGTCKVSPNTLWSGDGSAIDVTKKGQHVGYIYALGVQLGICLGPIDALVDIVFGSKRLANEGDSEAWQGASPYVQGTAATIGVAAAYATTTSARLPLTLADRQAGEKAAFSINAPDILGVKDPGGGVKGNLDVYFGTDTQPANDYLLAEITDGTLSPYAGLAYAVFRPGAADPTHSFEWGLSPQLPNVAFVVRRCPSVLGVSQYANIDGDANGAEVIYEMLTDARWGLGKSPALFDLASFQAAALTLFTEGRGYSAVLTASGQADTAISEVLRHIDGVLRRDPETGLTGLFLTRADYTLDALPVVNPSVADTCEWKPSSWSRTTNHVNVTYTARDADFQQRVVTAENLANVQSAGEVRAETIDFPGFSNPANAQWAAARSLKAISGGIGAARITANRTTSTLRKGGCFLLTWPAYGIANVVMRVSEITTGTLEDGTVEIDAVEDLFAIGDAIYTAPSAIGDAVPVALDVEPPHDLAVSSITGTTALARWVYAPGAVYTEVFVVAGATGSTDSANRVAVLAANATQFLVRGLANTTQYTVGVRHRNAKGAASAAVFATFITTSAAPALPRPAAIDVMRVSDAGTGDTSGPFGVVVGLYAADPSLDLVLERAPDKSGVPDTANITTVATVLGSAETYSDALANDGAARWYRTRHAIGTSLSDPTIWVRAVPAHLPSSPLRPAAIDAQVDDTGTTETPSQGSLTLAITDPQGRVLSCEMASRAGNAAWSDWAAETSASVALVEKQPSAIRYRVAAYDATNTLRTYLFGTVVPFNAGSQPVVGIETVSADSANEVTATIAGDSDTQSIVAYARTGSAPTSADVLANGTTQNGRSATFDFGAFTAATKVYVGAVGFNGAGGSGLASQLASGQVTTPAAPSTSRPSLTIIPVITSNQVDATVNPVTLTLDASNLPSAYTWDLLTGYTRGACTTPYANGSNSSTPLSAHPTESVTVAPKAPQWFVLAVTVGADVYTSDPVVVNPRIPAITDTGAVDRGAPFSDGSYALASGSADGFDLTPGTVDSTGRAVNEMFHVPTQTIDNISDGSVHGRATITQLGYADRAGTALDANSRLVNVQRIPLGQTANTGSVQIGGNPLSAYWDTTQSAWWCKINAHQLRIGTTAVPYPEGYVSLDTGLSKNYAVYIDDPNYTGGPGFYGVTSDPAATLGAEGRYIVGYAMSGAAGGGGSGGSSGGGGTGACFTGDTLVTMASGLVVPIATIRVGDLVLAPDAYSGGLHPARVEAVHIHHVTELVTLSTEDGATVETTPEHPFLAQDGEGGPIWVAAGDLTPGVRLMRRKMRRSLRPVRVMSVERVTRAEPVHVYNLTVERLHTYVAAGFAVHNTKLMP